MQVNQPQGGGAEPTTPRYDTIVILGATGKNIPREVDGGEVVSWAVGHKLAALDALEEFVDDIASGNCNIPSPLTAQASAALDLMHRREALGWDADEPNEAAPLDWKSAVARAKTTARKVFGETNDDAMQAIEYMAALLLVAEPAALAWGSAKPTTPGAYWIRGNTLEADALIQVKLDDGELWCNLHMSTTESNFGFGYRIAQLSDQFEWIGPLSEVSALVQGGAE